MASGYSTLKVEIQFGTGPLNTGGTWSDVSTYMQSFTCRRGRSDEFSDTAVGTAQLVLKNNDRRFDPLNPSPVYTNVGRPGTQVRVSALKSDGVTRSYLFWGRVAPRDGWMADYASTNTSSTVVSLVDAVALFATNKVDEDDTVWAANDTTATAVGLICDLVDPSSYITRSIDSAATIQLIGPPGVEVGMTCADVLRRLAATECGAWYVSAANTFVFLSRYAAVRDYATSEATFSAASVAFSADGFEFDSSSEVFNRIRVPYNGGDDVAREDDATSISAYGAHTLETDNLWALADAQADANALVWLARYKDQYSTVRGLKCFPERSSTVLDAVLGLELFERATVTFTPPGSGGAYSVAVFVLEVGHAINARSKSWEVTYSFVPAARWDWAGAWSDYLILGSGSLDTHKLAW